MTSRFHLEQDWQRLSAWAGVPLDTLLAKGPQHELHELPLHPVLRRAAVSGRRELTWMREGFIPSYACDERGAEQRSEAQAETLTCDSCFRGAFRRRRCLVPATVLNETRHLASGIQQPCAFRLESGAIFGIAGVWETWTNDQGHAIESFAVVTTLVTPVLQTLFDRMPVILTDQKEQERWLHSTSHEEQPVDLLKPLSTSELRVWNMIPGAVEMQLSQIAPNAAHQG